MHLNDAVVIVTGASEGVGAACATVFARRGAHLSLTARNAARLATAGGPNALVTPGDLTDPAVRRSVVERTVDRFGRIDVLVNNAGAGLYYPAHMTPIADVHAMFELNFFAAADMIQLVAPHMKRARRGCIVNVGSIAGKVTLPWFTAYSASKAALGSLTEGVRTELRNDGVHAMLVCPGYVKTDFQAHAMMGRPPELIGRMKKWAITPEACAEAIVRGVERDAKIVVTPASGWLLIAAARLVPSIVERQFSKIYFKEHNPRAEAHTPK